MSSRKQVYTQDFSGGLVINKLPHKLADNQSPKMLNMLPFDRNGIMMRTGQKYKTENPGTGSIYQVHERRYCGKIVFAAENGSQAGLYCDTQAGTGYTKITDLISQEKGVFFEFESVLYYLDGSEYLKITESDGELTATAVTGYVPLVYVNGKADGTNMSKSEDFNMLSDMYRVRYIPDGTEKEFILPYKVNSANYSKIKAYNLYPEKTGITAFTVSESGEKTKVTFTTAPPANQYYYGGNTLEIEAPNDETDAAAERQKVLKCRVEEEYGGSMGGLSSGTRVFISGNPDYPGSIWWSAVMAGTYSAAEYFPDVNVEVIGDAKKPITALSKQYNELIVFKERSIHGLSYSFTGEKAVFSIREIHGRIGCDMPYTVQLINNNLCFGNTYGGVNLLISTNNNDERNVVPISANVNMSEKISDTMQGILNFDENRLKKAVSFDDGQRYWLCIEPYVYLWDYGIKAYSNLSDVDEAQNRLSWWLLNNFNAMCWAQIDGVTHYGCSLKMDFVIPSPQYNDFGERINAYYKTKGYDGGDPTAWKNFKQIVFSQKTVGNGEVKFKYTADTIDIDGELTNTKTFSMGDFSFDTFTFAVVNYGDIQVVYPQLEHTAYFAWEVSNGIKDSDLFITDVKTIYFVQHVAY